MAERFSRFRDAGTGIQVFLPPVAPVGSGSPLQALLLPIGVILGLLRILLLIAISVLWLTFNTILGHLGRPVRSIIHLIFGRSFLFIIGFTWIPDEIVSLRNRGRASQSQNLSTFTPKKGDVILCNWSSWVDILILTIKYNPTFVRPVVKPKASENDTKENENNSPSSANKRRKGAAARGQQHAQMNAASQSPRSASTAGTGNSSSVSGEERMVGWNKLNFVLMMLESGPCPPSKSSDEKNSLEDILKSSDGPVVVFPELVTSNNRGLLRFESILPQSWRSLFRATGAVRTGAGQSNILILSIKHEPPTTLTPSTTLSVPAIPLSPIPHMLRLCFSPSFYSVSVRSLAEQESPTHSAFVADAQAVQRELTLTDKCADLMSSLCRLRRTNLDWQDKESFLTMYRKRS